MNELAETIAPGTSIRHVRTEPAEAVVARGIPLVGHRFRCGDFGLRVTPAHIDEWVRNFDAMRAKGARVPAYGGEPSLANLIGHVTGLARCGDWLLFKIHAHGEPGIAKAAALTPGLCVHADYVDGDGERYGQGVTSIVMTDSPTPVAPRLSLNA